MEFNGFGFWARDADLEIWLTTLVDELKNLSTLKPWQESLARYWREQATIDAGCISTGLDEFITDNERKAIVLSFARNALAVTHPGVRRTAILFIDLLEGKLNTLVHSTILRILRAIQNDLVVRETTI